MHNSLAAGLAAGQRDNVARKFRVEPTEGGLRVFHRSANRLAVLYAAVARRLGEELGQPASIRFEAGGPGEAECIMAIAVEEQTRRSPHDFRRRRREGGLPQQAGSSAGRGRKPTGLVAAAA